MALEKLLGPGFRLCDMDFWVVIAISERFSRAFFKFEKMQKIDFWHQKMCFFSSLVAELGRKLAAPKVRWCVLLKTCSGSSTRDVTAALHVVQHLYHTPGGTL